MLTAYRRHRADCKHRSRRYKGCSCPIWAQGKLHGVPLRRSLDLTSWEAAAKKIRDLEINGDVEILTVNEAGARFLTDMEANSFSYIMTVTASSTSVTGAPLTHSTTVQLTVK